MKNTVDILSYASAEPAATLKVVRLNESPTAVIPFTTQSVHVRTHYNDEADLKGTSLCGGNGCTLCAIGRRVDERLLLPVFLPIDNCVGVLPVPTTLTPHALLPQVHRELQAGEHRVLFITRISTKYEVTSRPLDKSAKSGEKIIAAFLKDLESGAVDLTAVFPKHDNALLAGVPEIMRMLELRGVNPATLGSGPADAG